LAEGECPVFVHEILVIHARLVHRLLANTKLTTNNICEQKLDARRSREGAQRIQASVSNFENRACMTTTYNEEVDAQRDYP
jgi:hypothetical protein